MTTDAQHDPPPFTLRQPYSWRGWWVKCFQCSEVVCLADTWAYVRRGLAVRLCRTCSDDQDQL